MPSRSLQHLPPRSPPRSPDRSAPCRARRRAGRAGSRHRHPLPDMQDNKAEHPAETRAVCQLPEDNMTGNQSGCLVPHTTLRGAGGRLGRCPAPGHPDSCRVCPHPPQTLELPRFPRLMCPGNPGAGLPDSGHATGWIWLARRSYSIGVSMPGDEWQPRRLRRDRSRRAGAGAGTRPRCGPGACPRARPAGSITAPGRLAVTPAARAGSPLRPRRVTATIALRLWSPAGTGRTLDGPVSMRHRVPGRAGHAPPARVFAPAVLAGRAGKVPAAGQLASHTVSAPRAFRDRLAKSKWRARPPAMAGRGMHTKRSRWRRAL